MKRNRYLEAFKENYNLVGLAATVAASAAMLHPVPLLAGLVAEAVYLLFYADSRWYQARLAKRYDAEVEARRAQLRERVLPTLDDGMKSRFRRLEKMRQNLDSQDLSNDDWFRDVLRKLDFLLEKWLQFASREVEFTEYLEAMRREMQADASRAAQDDDPMRQSGHILASKRAAHLSSVPLPAKGSARQRASARNRGGAARSTQRGDIDLWIRNAIAEIQSGYDAELAEIEAQRAGEKDFSTAAVLDKRIAVLKRRREFVEKIGRIHFNIVNQLSLVEDSFGLISDGIRVRSPEQVLADIDDVVTQTTTMTQLLDEVAPYEQLLAS